MENKDKVVVVTGAGAGIGAATSKKFLDNGFKVVLSDLKVSNVEPVAKGYDKDQYLLLAADVSDEDAVKNLVSKTIERFGKIDVLVNNAGVYGESEFTEGTTEEWNKLLGVDLNSVYFTSREILPHLKDTKGCIVNVSSLSGLGGEDGHPIYNAVKGGVTNLTRSLAVNYGKFGIRVNAVCPTFVNTLLTKEMLKNEHTVKKVLDRIPLNRIAEPEDIAKAIYFLASDEASFISGVNLPVDGAVNASSGHPLNVGSYE